MPGATIAFCVGLHPSLVQLDRDCREGGGLGIAGADDCYAIRPVDLVLAAVHRFQVEVRVGLQFDKPDSGMFCSEGGVPHSAPAGLKLAGKEVEGVSRRGFLCFGCPVGEVEYVVDKLEAVVERIVTDAGKAVNLLAGDRQAEWTTLRASTVHQFRYWCQLIRPALVQGVAANLDDQLWRVFKVAAGFKAPQAVHLLG
jgi:hypothetical protein